MKKTFKARLLTLPTPVKRFILAGSDVVILFIALWVSFVLRLGSFERINPFWGYLPLFVTMLCISLPCLVYFKLNKTVNRFFGGEAILAIVKAMSLASLLFALFIYWIQPSLLIPRSIVFIFWWLSILLMVIFRLAVRQYLTKDWHLAFFRHRQKNKTYVAIYGAGIAGNQLLSSLRMTKDLHPIGFIDDDQHLIGRSVSGLRVYPAAQMERLVNQLGVQEVLLAIPSVSRSRRREIITFLEQYAVKIRSIPGVSDLASGRVKVDDIQEIDIIDVLGRDAVPPNEQLFEYCIKDKVVMVTGAGGSIGSELCRQIASIGVKTLILFEQSEYNLYSILAELRIDIEQKQLDIELVPILGSVRNAEQLLQVMECYKVETVYHAAAYKHVPMVERNISEGILNNVIGTLTVAQASIIAKVSNFVLISTDKAVRPTNIMGATKRLAEMILQALSHEFNPVLFGMGQQGVVQQTCFTMVRFGNVLGSSGSVIPLFRSQIQKGGPITVTHPDITRYFMTIPEAAQLVIQAGSMGDGGDVFVLDMGQPIKIKDLAEKMIALSGLDLITERNPCGDIAIKFTGLRPGEKLFEELLISENVIGTEHPMIMCANEAYLPWDEMKKLLKTILDTLEQGDFEQIQRILSDPIIGYHSESTLVDWQYLQQHKAISLHDSNLE